MLIAIDFDDTLTADGELWRNFIESGRKLGHRFVCVTARRDTAENNEMVQRWLDMHGIELGVHYTGLASKVDYAEKRGLKVDIWIDDCPRTCALGH